MLGRAGVPALGRLVPNQIENALVVMDWEREHTPKTSDFTGRKDNEATVYAGNAASFDGVNDELDCGDIGNVQTVALWVRVDTASEQIIDLNGTQSIEVSSNTVTLNGTWTGSAVYVNGAVSTTLAEDIWHHLVVTVTAAIDASAVKLARIGANYGALDAGHLSLYSAAATADEVSYAYDNAALPHQDPDGSLTASDLKGHWLLDEGFWDANFTTAFDHSGNGNHATNTSGGATAVTGEEKIPQTAENGFTRAIRFDGTDDDVTFTSAVANMRQDWTVALLVEIEDISSARCLFSWANSGGDGAQIAHDGSGNLYCRVDVSGGANQTVSSTHTFAVTDVAHVVVAHDVSAKTLYFYVDGSGAGSDTYTGDLPNSGATVGTIGDGTDLSNAKGIATEVAQFSALFDATDVTELYNSGDPLDATLHTETPDGYWRNGWLTSAGTWEDLSANSNHGTINGTPDEIILSARHDDATRDALGGFIRQTRRLALAETGCAQVTEADAVSNGTFDDATGWTATSPWSISGGLATIDGSQAGNTDLTQSLSYTENDYYEITFDVVRRAAGTVTAKVNGTSGTGRTAAGTYREVVQAGASGGLVFTADASFDGDIDNVVSRRLGPVDIFDGGGTLSFWARAHSIGAGSFGRLAEKTAWGWWLRNASGGNCDARFHYVFSAVNGDWDTSNRPITFGTPFFIAITYDRTGDPIVYFGEDGVLSTLTVGDGLTEVATPSGTPTSEAGNRLFIGDREAQDRAFDGNMGQVAMFDAVLSASDILRLYQAGRAQYGA